VNTFTKHLGGFLIALEGSLIDSNKVIEYTTLGKRMAITYRQK
jgi:hypothetical protein